MAWAPDATWAGQAWEADLARELRNFGFHNWQLSIGTMLSDSIGQLGSGLSRQMQMLLEIFERGFAPNERARLHREVAELGQQAVLRSYDQTVTRRKGAAGQVPYRTAANRPGNRRYAGGALRRALAAGDFYEADAESIRFINVQRLDIEARHWARLNAGTVGRGTGSMRTFEIRFRDLVVGSIGLNMAARPAFYLPRGYWWNNEGDQPVGPNPGARGQHLFYPMSEGPRAGSSAGYFMATNAEGRRYRVRLQRRRLSRGIQARNFLDAGLARIARELGPAYDRLMQDAWSGAIAGARDELRVVARPRPGQWSVKTRRRPTTRPLYARGT